MNDGVITIAEWRAAGAAADGPFRAVLHVQIAHRAEKPTREGKPYLEIEIADASSRETLRIWNNTPFYAACSDLAAEDWAEVDGEFAPKHNHGIDPRALRIRLLTAEEIDAALVGSAERNARLHADYSLIAGTVASIQDPRLQGVCALFLERHGPRFRRAAAARTYHHARRGGLLEHTAQMIRSVLAICGVYPVLNRDLLVAAVLFHDCGKLWECCPPERGFAIAPTETGELLGHITIGIELVNKLWSELAKSEEFKLWERLTPRSETVRQHVLHLIASHHGELAFGSPVLPKTPEAIVLHHVDNIDARLEMFAGAYAHGVELAPGVFERVKPLTSSLIRPLPALRDPNDGPSGLSNAAE